MSQLLNVTYSSLRRPPYHHLLAIALCFMGVQARAQAAWGNPIIQGWQGDTLIWAEFDGSAGINFETGRPGEPPSRWTPPFRSVKLQMQGDSCLMLNAEADSKGRTVYAYSLRTGMEFLGRVPKDLPVSRLFPVGEGYLVQAASPGYFVLDKKASPWAFTRFGDDGNLKLERLVDFDCFGGPVVERIATPRRPSQDGDPALFRRNPGLRTFLANHLFASNPFVSTGETGVLIFNWPGYLILLNKEGEARKVVKIYPEFDSTKLGALFTYEPVIQGAALTRDGNLLLAVREKEGVFGAAKFPLNLSADASEEERTKSSENAEKRRSQFTKIRWVELNPESGQLTWLDQAPSGAPSSLEELKDRNLFGFVVNRDGSVRRIDRIE